MRTPCGVSRRHLPGADSNWTTMSNVPARSRASSQRDIASSVALPSFVQDEGLQQQLGIWAELNQRTGQEHDCSLSHFRRCEAPLPLKRRSRRDRTHAATFRTRDRNGSAGSQDGGSDLAADLARAGRSRQGGEPEHSERFQTGSEAGRRIEAHEIIARAREDAAVRPGCFGSAIPGFAVPAGVDRNDDASHPTKEKKGGSFIKIENIFIFFRAPPGSDHSGSL